MGRSKKNKKQNVWEEPRYCKIEIPDRKPGYYGNDWTLLNDKFLEAFCKALETKKMQRLYWKMSRRRFYSEEWGGYECTHEGRCEDDNWYWEYDTDDIDFEEYDGTSHDEYIIDKVIDVTGTFTGDRCSNDDVSYMKSLAEIAQKIIEGGFLKDGESLIDWHDRLHKQMTQIIYVDSKDSVIGHLTKEKPFDRRYCDGFPKFSFWGLCYDQLKHGNTGYGKDYPEEFLLFCDFRCTELEIIEKYFYYIDYIYGSENEDEYCGGLVDSEYIDMNRPMYEYKGMKYNKDMI